MAVVCVFLWFNVLPMMDRLAPVEACQDPIERRRSCMRRSAMPAVFRSACHAFLGSTMCPDSPLLGNTHFDPLRRLFRYLDGVTYQRYDVAILGFHVLP